MYTRSYYDNDGVAYTLSGSYDGTALRDEPPPVHNPRIRDEGAIPREITKCSPCENESCEDTQECSECGGRDTGFLGGIRGWLDNILPVKFIPDKFGIEELLILGLAAYLFFTKSGDKEFAIMLAVLIFISG